MQLAVVFGTIALAWLLAYSAILGAIGSVLHEPGVQRAMRWLTGTIHMALGARVAVERA